MGAYYNEIDPYCAAWLRNLIAAGHIAAGEVDERSILDVRPDDLHGFDQCHFFAGIGGWSLALRLAGWPDSRPAWTGSCPCQPFSAAGKRRGFADERHLWPAWFHLLGQCHPAVLFGEQVAGAAALAWLDLVFTDLEGAGYAAAAADLPACSVGAPHRRQRLYWVAHDDSERQQGQRLRVLEGRPRQAGVEAARGCEVGVVGNAAAGRWPQRDAPRSEAGREGYRPVNASALDAWANIEWLQCSDGKARPTLAGLFPLAHGATARVGRLRAYGNAIVPQVAAAFVTAVMDCMPA